MCVLPEPLDALFHSHHLKYKKKKKKANELRAIYRNKRKLIERVELTEIFYCCMDSVATVEEETNKPGANEATTTSYAHCLLSTVFSFHFLISLSVLTQPHVSFSFCFGSLNSTTRGHVRQVNHCEFPM